MKGNTRTKAGKRAGNPGFRTSAVFKYQQAKKVANFLKPPKY